MAKNFLHSPEHALFTSDRTRQLNGSVDDLARRNRFPMDSEPDGITRARRQRITDALCILACGAAGAFYALALALQI